MSLGLGIGGSRLKKFAYATPANPAIERDVRHPGIPGDTKLKRAFDILCSLTTILMLLPFLIMLTSLLLVVQGRPVLIRHRRVGYGAKAFDCLKFRTMVPDADLRLVQHLASNSQAHAEWSATRKLKNDPRITPLGHILRRSSMDELPQLFNILFGDMSVVGPRPVVEDELKFYGPHTIEYIKVRPGLTGLWQVSGRSETSYEKRVELDVTYVKIMSFTEDLKIIMRTIPRLVSLYGSY